MKKKTKKIIKVICWLLNILAVVVFILGIIIGIDRGVAHILCKHIGCYYYEEYVFIWQNAMPFWLLTLLISFSLLFISRKLSLKIKEIECLNLYSNNIQGMVYFYHNILKLPIVFEGFNGTYNGVRIATNDNQLQICILDKKITDNHQEDEPVSILIKANTKRRFEDIKDAGYEVCPFEHKKGRIELKLIDPDGNYVCVVD